MRAARHQRAVETRSGAEGSPGERDEATGGAADVGSEPGQIPADGRPGRGGPPPAPVALAADVPLPAEDAPRTSRQVVFGIVSIALFMASIDATIVATALPTIHRDLHASINWAGWTITIYALGQILAMPLAGKISDQFGRRKVFLGAVALFTTTSLCCGFANSIYLLVVLRAIQALGGGAFMPSATGIVSDHFGSSRDRALGLFTSIFPIGGIVGPVLGGLFVAYWSWRGIFLVNVPIGILLGVLAFRFIPESRKRRVGRTDLVGVCMLGGLILSAMFGITSLGSGTVRVYDPVFVVPELVAIVLLVAFVRHSRQAEAPFIPLRLIRGQGFAVMNLLNFLYGSAALGVGALVPLYAEDRFHIAPLDAGTLLTARAVGMVLIAGTAAMLLRRTGYRLPMTIGYSLTAIGLLLMSIAPRFGLSPYGWLAGAAAITGLGIGTAGPASNNATLQLAPDDVAAIAGLRGMFRQSGGIVAVSLTTAILARSNDPGLSQAHVYDVLAAVLVLIVIPLVYLVPDYKGRW